jgi:hypothetical protein
MSGLSKTHGFVIPIGLNVNSRGKQQRAVRLCEMAPQSIQEPKSEGKLSAR